MVKSSILTWWKGAVASLSSYAFFRRWESSFICLPEALTGFASMMAGTLVIGRSSAFYRTSVAGGPWSQTGDANVSVLALRSLVASASPAMLVCLR